MEVDLADQQTRIYEHADLAEHPGRCAGKLMQVGKRITVDGITEE